MAGSSYGRFLHIGQIVEIGQIILSNTLINIKSLNEEHINLLNKVRRLYHCHSTYDFIHHHIRNNRMDKIKHQIRSCTIRST